MARGLLSVHVIVLIPVVLSYHLRTSAILAGFRLTFDQSRLCAEGLERQRRGEEVL